MRVAINGYGRMGREVESVAKNRGHQVVGVFTTAEPIDSGLDADLVIDFTHAEAMERLIDVAIDTGTSVVSGTTGWEPAQSRARIESSNIGFVHAPNFSPGAAVLFAAAAAAARTAAAFGGEFSAAIHERHHAGKKDSPSGTAIRLADQVRRSNDHFTPEITAARLGHEAGLHTLILDGPTDLVEITHRARGRTGFATGAVIAAELLHGRHGFFTLEELLSSS